MPITPLGIAVPLLLLFQAVLFAEVPTYEEQAQQEIEQYRKVQIEEKKIEVLARLKQMSSPQVFNATSNNTSVRSFNKNTSVNSSESEIEQ